jgi:hypothetical protein
MVLAGHFGCFLDGIRLLPLTEHYTHMASGPDSIKKTATIASQGHNINKNSHKNYYKNLEVFNIIRRF